MEKRYFFVSYVLTYDGMFGAHRIYGNATVDTENGKYIQLNNVEESLLSAHLSINKHSNPHIKVQNIIELNEKDYNELTK